MTGNVEPVLKVEDLSLSYITRRAIIQAVRNISFEVGPGETYGLVGESGCGKSTLALGVMNYLGFNGRADTGRILFEGDDVLKKNEDALRKIRGAKIAMVYQDPLASLNPVLRIGDQMTEVLEVHKHMSKREAKEKCLEMLAKVHMADPAAVVARFPHQLSGGQQQRVIIATALLTSPSLLIMDEPTTGLDVTVEAKVLDLIAELRLEFNSSILYISHNLGVVARVCDRVGVMYAGELVEEAPVEEMFLRPLHPYTAGLLNCLPRIDSALGKGTLQSIRGQVPTMAKLPAGCIFGARCDYSGNACHADRPGLVEIAPGHKVRCFSNHGDEIQKNMGLRRQAVAATAAVAAEATAGNGNGQLLKLDKLKSHYTQADNSLASLIGRGKKRYVKAVDGVDFGIEHGHVLGVVGESGCGKSTLARCISGLVSPSGGTMEFHSVDIAKVVEKRDRHLLQELQMVFQNPDSTLNPSHSVGQAIARPLKLFGVVPRKDVDKEVRRLLRAVKLDESIMDRHTNHLSGGQKQRIAIARAFAGKPDLVICDEPVASLDVSVQASILNLLLDFQKEYGTAMIFIGHDLSVVRYVSDYIAVMYLGKVCELGPADEMFKPPYHPYTEALLSAVPIPDPTVEQKNIRLSGTVPSALNPPSGCRFHTRCHRKVGEICETTEPPAVESGSQSHKIYCHQPVLAAVH